MRLSLTVLLVAAALVPARAQLALVPEPPPPADTGLHQGRFVGVVVGTAVMYGLSTYLLGKTWYTRRVPFHSFNDNGEWLQMDKLGHATTAYAISQGEYQLLRWSGASEHASIVSGSLISLLFQTTIELFDGRSEGWGFSKGDMAANLAGVALFAGQQYGFGEQKVSLRYGWRRSIYPQYRPELLGRGLGSQLVKDYNAQQYWLSVNVASVLPVGPTFPRWLTLDVGYSGSGMTGGHANPPYFDTNGNELRFTRYRQFYLSPGANLSRIGSLNDTGQRLLAAGQFFRLPAPSVEYSRLHGVRFHPLFVSKD